MLVAVKATAHSRGVLTPHTVHWTLFRYACSASGTNAKTHKIASNKKYKFQFLAKDVPNVRSLFIIHGQRYICEKITANFTENGMSELMKGEFWLVED